MTGILSYADEIRRYYEIAEPYKPLRSNPALFLGPPVDMFRVELLSEAHNRHVITQSPCQAPGDCRGRFSHDKASGTASVEALGTSQPGKWHQNILYLTYGFDFRLDLAVLLHPWHSIVIFPEVNIELDWDATAPGSDVSLDVHAKWVVIDGSTGKPANTGVAHGLSPRSRLFKQVSATSSSTQNQGQIRQFFAPFDAQGQSLYREQCPLKPGVTFRMLVTFSVKAFASNGAKCRSKAGISFSTVA